MTTLPNGTSYLPRSSSFASLFKRYRLRSEIKSLSEFADLLAEEGFAYETSIFTKWQNGDRVPKDRGLLLATLRVFVKQKGIQTVQEANHFIESANQRTLTGEERAEILPLLSTKLLKSLPTNPTLFIQRENIVKNTEWNLLHNGSVYLYGLPGMGKTYIALHVAHNLQKLFPDGIFWYRADLRSLDSIIDDILLCLGHNPQEYGNLDNKIVKLKQVLLEQSVLIVLDNLTDTSLETAKVISKLPIRIMITSIIKHPDISPKYIYIPPFTHSEYYQLCEEILGKPFLEINKEILRQVGGLIGFTPITTVVSLRQIYMNPHSLSEFIFELTNKPINLRKQSYDDKNLYVAIDYAFSKLEKKLQNILISCALFESTDFSYTMIGKIVSIPKYVALKSLKVLEQYSLVEASLKGRYRLHPIIKIYLEPYLQKKQLKFLSEIYIKLLKKKKQGTNTYILFLASEIDNIIGTLKKLFEACEFKLFTELWSLVSLYIFISGNWRVMFELDIQIRTAFSKTKNQQGLAIYLMEDIGRIYFYQSNQKKLSKIFLKADSIFNITQDILLGGLIKQKRGVVAMFDGKLDNSEQYLLESIEILKSYGTRTQLVKSHAYLGMVYAKLENFGKAIKNLRYAIKYTKLLEDKSVVGFIYAYLGYSYLKMGRLEDAKTYFREGLLFSRKYRVIIGIAMAQEGLCALYKQLKINSKIILKYSQSYIHYYKLLKIGPSKRLLCV